MDMNKPSMIAMNKLDSQGLHMNICGMKNSLVVARVQLDFTIH